MHPSLKPRKAWPLAFGLLLGACNVFNPSGTGDGGTSVDAKLTAGENAFRDQDYPAAMAAYSEAIAADSSNSLAYYGYAKAVMRYYQVNPSSLLNEVTTAKANNSIPFLTTADATVTRYLQATSKVRWALSTLTQRDTLTRWYQYSVDSTSAGARKDALRDKRIAFMNAYWSSADKGLPGFYPKAKFPLSDLKLGYDKIIADFGFVELIYAVTHLKDLDGNDTIDERDNLINSLKFNVSDGFKIDSLQNIQDSLSTPENRAKMNNLIKNVSSSLTSAHDIVGLLGPILSQNGAAPGDTAGGLQDKVTQNVDSVISQMGGAITFYQFGDGLDNDGDGCVDEEIMDGKDNDGDGLIDEDARVVPAIVGDDVDNDHNGVKDLEDPNEGLDSQDRLIFTTDPSFVKGPSYTDKAMKAWVQADSLAVKYARGPLSAGDKVVLDSAKHAIGGCWNNYK